MRPARALIVALLLAVLPGCLGDRPTRSTSWLRRMSPFQGVGGPDAVHIDVAFVEIPLADAARFRTLWTFLDEGVIPLEKKGNLEENGFRVGLAGNSPPPELHSLLTEKRTLADSRRIQMQAGKEQRLLEIGKPVPSLAFSVSDSGQTTPVELEQAQCTLALAPSFPDTSKVHLTITPRVRHASKGKTPWRPRADRTGWMLNLQQPVESFPEAGFEVTLTPGEYLVVGCRFDRPGTLGYETFVRTGEKMPSQKLVVFRAYRPDQPESPASTSLLLDRPGAGPVPLAAQAGRPSIRGVSP